MSASVNTQADDFLVDESGGILPDVVPIGFSLWSESGTSLSDEAVRHLEAKGLAPDDLAPPQHNQQWTPPSPETIHTAGDCDIPLGASLLEALATCAQNLRATPADAAALAVELHKLHSGSDIPQPIQHMLRR